MIKNKKAKRQRAKDILTMRSAGNGKPAASPPQPVCHRIMLGIPNGGQISVETAFWLNQCTREHRVMLEKSSGGWDNFSILWGAALNAYEFGVPEEHLAPGDLTHFAMCHADIMPQPAALDVLVREMEARGASLISAVVPIKNCKGILSSGVGSTGNIWNPWRRLTLHEVFNPEYGLPATFDLDDIKRSIPGKWPEDKEHGTSYLLHNNGLWLADLRDPLWHAEGADGNANVFFQFTKRMRRGPDGAPGTPGRWQVQGESEDWFFARRVFEAGVKSVLTRKVGLVHEAGMVKLTNTEDWGSEKHDEETRAQWGD